MTYIWVGVVVQAVISAGFCAILAEEKNRSVPVWVMLGLGFGLYSLVAIAGLPPLPDRITGALNEGPDNGVSKSRQKALDVLREIQKERAKGPREAVRHIHKNNVSGISVGHLQRLEGHVLFVGKFPNVVLAVRASADGA